MSWNEEALLAAFDSLRMRKGDSASIEVKRAEHGLPESLAETSCAFANMPEGGTIVLGVDDPAFEIFGVSNPAELEAGLVSKARNAVTPPPQINAYTMEIQGKPLVVAEVVPLRVIDRPATCAGKAYLRQSDGDYVMHEHELRMLDVDKLHATEQVEYDKRSVKGLTQADLQPELLTQYLDNARRADPRLANASDSDILRWTGVVVASGEPTVAGLYALGSYPQGEYPSLTVTAAVQLPSGSQARTKNLVDFTGPIPVLLKEILSWVEQNLSVNRRYRDDGHMVREPELPLRAVRELIANALVHRDLGPNTLDMGKSIQIRLSQSGLFVLNPGGLRGVSRQQLESDDHAQAAVNQRLYNIAKKLTTDDGASIIEGEGGGIRTVFDSTAAAGLRRPTLTDTGVQFKATLWRPDDTPAPTPPRPELEQATRPAREVRDGNTGLVLTALAQGPLTAKQIRERAQLSRGSVYYALNQLRETNEVVMRGKQGDRGTTYALS
ncbi:RNA-binding domain-containing protein [Dermacoccus abyssi]|uniref:RNA-binding domain-containing protein n=1 Tax=Dermacoccus abyssi TaxID=322596 RepID=UPI002AD463E1|nr:RNA-binding domain-containing protein [Dermacoccus abyssi]